jgi:hypothetical protein
VSRSKILSALVLGGALAGPAAGQTPDVVKEVKTLVEAADPIAGAVRNHPDVRVAEAKLRVAEAELAQAKLLVAQRVTVAQAKLQDAQVRAEHAARSLKRVQEIRKTGGVPAELVETHEKELALARAAAVAAEAELKTAQGVGPALKSAVSFTGPEGTLTASGLEVVLSDGTLTLDKQARLGLELLAAGVKAPPGSAVDRLRGALDNPVKLDMAARVVLASGIAELLAKSGLEGMTVRLPVSAQDKMLKTPPAVGPLAGEHTVAAWLQLMIDDFNTGVAAGLTTPDEQGKYDVYVRDYGLLVTRVELAPKGAITLGEFARQVRAEKAAKAAVGEPKKP